MRFAALGLIALCLVAVTLATPAKKEVPTDACSRQCGDYEPVCAKAKNGSKERLITFGSDCVMSKYNCQHTDDPFEVKSKGECGGNVSVRLS